MNELLLNIDKIHTTKMGIERIKKNLKLKNDNIIDYCKKILLDKESNIYKQGKNWYCIFNDTIITINSYSYTIITAHIINVMTKIPNNHFINSYDEKNFVDSPLVSITEDMGFIIDMQYPKLGMKKAINKCLLRKEVLEKLMLAKAYLPKQYTFKIWDAYRPLSLQKELYYIYKDKIIKEFHLENLSIENQNKVIKNYVSLPDENEELPPLHTTGGAIDLTLVNIETGKELDMGVKFDEFTNLTNSNSYEKKGMSEEIRNNRRLLYNVMIKAGFTNLPSEIWHYDYGDRAWAFYNKKPAIYKGIFEFEIK